MANYHIRCQNREGQGKSLRNNNVPAYAELTQSLTEISLLGKDAQKKIEGAQH
jgi:hypothetical protein